MTIHYNAGKGDDRRPAQVPRETYEKAFDQLDWKNDPPCSCCREWGPEIPGGFWCGVCGGYVPTYKEFVSFRTFEDSDDSCSVCGYSPFDSCGCFEE
jgi:hypothetical protein